MKKISLLAAVFAFGTVASAAMSDYNIYVGAGVNMFKPKNKFDDGNDADSNKENVAYGNKIGFNAGALGYIKMADMVSLRTGAFWSMKKFEVKDGQSDPGVRDVTLSYVDVPVTLSYSMNKMAHLYAGAVVSFKASYSEDGTTATEADDINDDNLKSFLVTGTVGGQFNVMDRVGVDVFAEMGFGSMLDLTDEDTDNGDDNDLAKSPIGFGARVVYKF